MNGEKVGTKKGTTVQRYNGIMAQGRKGKRGRMGEGATD
jgi:hypothetical protein